MYVRFTLPGKGGPTRPSVTRNGEERKSIEWRRERYIDQEERERERIVVRKEKRERERDAED